MSALLTVVACSRSTCSPKGAYVFEVLIILMAFLLFFSDQNKPSIAVGEIIGICIGCAAVPLALLLVVLVCKYKCIPNKKRARSRTNSSQGTSSIDLIDTAPHNKVKEWVWTENWSRGLLPYNYQFLNYAFSTHFRRLFWGACPQTTRWLMVTHLLYPFSPLTLKSDLRALPRLCGVYCKSSLPKDVIM